MRKRVFGRQLSRARSTRTALNRSLLRALFLHSQIVTTRAKAKFIQGDVDKILTMVRKSNLSNQKLSYVRRVLAKLGNDRLVTEKLFKDYGQVVAKRTSGFSRIVNLPRRKGDNAQMVRLEFIEKPLFKQVKAIKKVSEEKKVNKNLPAGKAGVKIKNENVSAKK